MDSEIIIIEDAISIAQFIKNCCGKIVIISSVYGLKVQLSLPGKKILWNTVNALLKSIETIAIKRAKIPNIEMQEIKDTCIPKGFIRVITFFLFNIKRHIVVALDSNNTIKFRSNNALQSTKCALPASEYANEPVPKA